MVDSEKCSTPNLMPGVVGTVGALRKSEFKKRKRAKIGPGINQLGSESESESELGFQEINSRSLSHSPGVLRVVSNGQLKSESERESRSQELIN